MPKKTAQTTKTDSKKQAKPEQAQEQQPKKAKRPRVRLGSTTIPGLWVRAYVDVVEKYGYPLDPNGEKMVPVEPPRGGLSAEERARRKAEKEAEKAKLEAMSDEERAEYKRQKREERKAARAQKKAKEREELIAKLKEEIKAGRL